MILLNLLPHREEARKRRRQNFFTSLIFAVLVGLCLAMLVNWVLGYMQEEQLGKNEKLKAEIALLDKQIVEVANLESEITGLLARKKAVEDLQVDRNIPVHLVTELARLMPDGAYLTSVRQDAGKISLTGVAQSNQRISEFLRNLSTSSQWLEEPELIEIVASTTNVSAREQRPTATFSMVVKQKRQGVSNAPQGAASAPAKS
jgi:type IV pilus assembly protein PilN